MVQLGERNSVEQHSVCSKTYPNLSPIAPLLPGTAGAPSYCGKPDITEIHPATPHIDRISPFQVYRIHQETLLQYFPNLLRGNPHLGRAFSSLIHRMWACLMNCSGVRSCACVLVA